MRFHRKLATVALAVLMIVVVAATALAASPKKGAKFTGTLLNYKTGTLTGPIKIGNFRAPVTFKVSSNGSMILGLKYGYLGCFGAGGFGNHNPYALPSAIKRFGSISVSANGSFSAPATKVTFKASGGTGTSHFTSALTTTSSLTGRFTTAKKATGTITFTQKDVFNGGKPSSCGPVSLTFSAKAS